MSILTEGEISNLSKEHLSIIDGIHQDDVIWDSWTKTFAEEVERKVLAKLAGMELPEQVAARWPSVPGSHHYAGAVGCNPGSFGEESEDLYTSAQLHQAYAQGAASQLCAEPVSGQSRFDGVMQWTPCTTEHVGMVINASSEFKGYQVRYLYTLKDAK